MFKPSVFCSISLAFACAGPALLFSGCEAKTPSKQSMGAGDQGDQLHDGMGLLEVEVALGCTGKPMDWGRRVETPDDDPEAWSAEWRLECIYDLDPDTDVIAVFTAWTPEETISNPPDSAYRLISWGARDETSAESVAFWGSGN
jgi:hypothetical protein